jgi:hypothetical protein
VKRAVFTTLSVVAIAACSLGDFAGYSDGDEVAPDAASPDSPSSALDGGDNGGDSSTPGDAGGSDAVGEAATKFCQANGDAGFFCEDFEGLNALTHFVVTSTVGGTLAVDKGTMVAEVPAGSAPAMVYGQISAKTVASGARLSFRVQPEILNTTTAVSNQIAKIYFFAENKAPYEVGMGIGGAGSSQVYVYEYTEGGGYKEFGNYPPLTGNVMTQFVLEARIDPNTAIGARVNVYRDGVHIVNNGVLSPPAPAGNIEASIGIPYTPSNHGAWKMRIDDIVMRLVP